MLYHFADHHDIGSQVLVYSKDVEDSDVPEDDVDTVDDPPIAHGRFVLQSQQQTQQEDGDGHQVCDIPVILQPHADLLLQLAWLRHQDLPTEPSVIHIPLVSHKALGSSLSVSIYVPSSLHK